MSKLPLPPPSLPPPPLHASTQMGGGLSLTESLLSTTSAADARNREATLMFQNIAIVLDEAIGDNDTLPLHLKKKFREFVTDLNLVARRHFECHVRGSPRPPNPYLAAQAIQTTQATQKVSQSTASLGPTSQLSGKKLFAAVAANPAPKPSRPQPLSKQAGPPKKLSQNTNREKLAKPLEDNRLLVRVSSGHPALDISPYAVMEQLNNFLDQKLVREVQTTKTGFAICPASAAAQETLASKITEIQTFLSSRGQCIVEKPESHSAYRISGVPRTYVGYNKEGAVEAIEINEASLAEALTVLTHVAPLNVLESRGTVTSDFSPCKSWVVLYPRGTSLSRSLPLFGVRVVAKLLPQRTRIPQCGRCFSWHNERACARVPRCRICSSTQHVESGHVSCNPAVAHSCPPKCVNCHGPHPADSLECLVRPRKDNTFPSKQQTSAIRQAAAAARLRLKAAHCGIIRTQPTENTKSNFSTSSISQGSRTNIGPSEALDIGLGRYEILAEDSHQRRPDQMNELYTKYY